MRQRARWYQACRSLRLPTGASPGASGAAIGTAGAPGWVRLRIRADDRYWPDLVMQVMR